MFQKHLGTFVEAVWGLLTQLGVQPTFDKLAVSAIKFLSSVLKGTHYSFFQPAHLQSIVSNVVVPGLRIRESDEEDFEDNPLEYMQKDLEGVSHPHMCNPLEVSDERDRDAGRA